MVQEALSRLKTHIAEIPGRFRQFSEEEANTPPAPGKWSKKEILGHLIDSANNNHSRFVRGQFQAEPVNLIKYSQDEWVSLQDYREEDMETIVKLWEAYNRHIAHVISGMPEDKYKVLWDAGGDEPVTMEWLIKDYVDHMEHHFKAIFNQ